MKKHPAVSTSKASGPRAGSVARLPVCDEIGCLARSGNKPAVKIVERCVHYLQTYREKLATLRKRRSVQTFMKILELVERRFYAEIARLACKCGRCGRRIREILKPCQSTRFAEVTVQTAFA